MLTHMGLRPPPLTLYLHIPYCLHKCPYCDFASSAVTPIPEQRYLTALQRELQWRRQQLADDPRPLATIFLGGGTPSLFSSATIETTLATISRLWPLENDCEITLEANPESASPQKMREWQQMGINRLSLGIQALDAERLHFLERPHTLEQARQAIAHLKQTGFARFNLDLIYATPGQTAAAWEKELTEAMAWEPHHLSCYQLTLEPGTPFFQRQQGGAWQPMTEEDESRLFQQTRQQLTAGGWQPYETSNFAKPGHHCRHNCNYWSFGDYLGVGAAAHGKWTDDLGRIWRSENPASATHYMTLMEKEPPDDTQHPILHHRLITPTEAGRELLLMGLRQQAGVDLTLYQQITGESLEQCRAIPIAHLLEAGFIQRTEQRLTLTEQGIILTDAILSRLI